jgi:membrane protein YqaA with SNARE-associated domain
MSALEPSAVSWLLIGCFGAAILSALVPWVNGEVVMLSALPMAAAHGKLVALVLAVTLGQMIGKSTMYWLSRNASGAHARRVQGAVERWRSRFERHPHSALGVVLVSALVGFPPFYAVSIAAGAFKMPFGRFLAVGSVSRVAHFAIFAFLPHVAWRGL